MSNDATVLSFDILMSQIQANNSLVKARENDLNQAKSELFGKIRNFNKKRLEIFEAQLRINKILWCTVCNQMFPDDQFSLVLVVERRSRTCGYQGGEYYYEITEKFHRVCATCKDKVYERNGWYGPYDHVACDQESYFVHQVEFRDGGYYHGSKRIEKTLPEISPVLFTKLSQEWGIPPQLGLDRSGNLATKGNGNEILVL